MVSTQTLLTARSDFPWMFESGEGFGGEIETGGEFLPGDVLEQMQGDGAGHGFAHQVYGFALEDVLDVGVPLHEGGPLRQRKLGARTLVTHAMRRKLTAVNDGRQPGWL
jgi:hypothetical protein